MYCVWGFGFGFWFGFCLVVGVIVFAGLVL